MAPITAGERSMAYWLEFLGAAGTDARRQTVLRYNADRTATARVKLARTLSLYRHTHHNYTTRHDGKEP